MHGNGSEEGPKTGWFLSPRVQGEELGVAGGRVGLRVKIPARGCLSGSGEFTSC